MTSLETQDKSIEGRLLRLKKEVQKTTQDAFRQATIGETPHVAENDDPNASFHLGMELFGQDPSVVEENLQNRLSEMEEELENILSDIESKSARAASSPEPSSALARRNLTPEQAQQEEQVLRTKIEFLRHCSQIRTLLDQAVTLSTPALSPTSLNRVAAAHKLFEAEDIWQQTHKLLLASGTTPAAQAAAEQILQSLRRSLRNQKVDLLDKTKAMWKACLTTPASHSIQVKGGPVLEEAYQVMEVFAERGHPVLQDVMRKFTKQLYDEALKEAIAVGENRSLSMSPMKFHVVEERSSLSTVVLSSTTTTGTWKTLEWERKDEETVILAPVRSWKESLLFLQTILVFVADNILLGRAGLCELVGNRLLGRPSALPSALRLEELGLESCRIGDDTGLLMEPLVEALAQTCLPDELKPFEMGQLEERQRELEAIVMPFLSVMVEKGLMSSTECRLQNFTNAFVQKYVENRRCQKLNQVRELLMKNDYHNTVMVGEVYDKDSNLLGVGDGMSVFKLHRASVSETAQHLMSICRACMDEAVEQADLKHGSDSPLSLLSATLYKTARESLDLYRAIIPVQYRSEIERVPRTAAVFHNDCVFFAHHCQILGIEYKERFPAPSSKDSQGRVLHQTFIFVDMVPAFRSLAETAMRKMLDRQAQEIRSLLGERIALFGKALRSDEILAEWTETESATNAGLYHIRHLSQAWKSVLSYEIFNRCICFLADVMFTLLLEEVGKATDISTTACQFVNSLFERAISGISEHLDGDVSSSQVYERFSCIGKCMDMSLNDINLGLSKGAFRSVTGQELTRLIKATFDDSPKRRDLLRLLNAHH